MPVPPKLHNPNLSTKSISDYKWNKGIPTRENCNLEDPKEMFLWMLVALPGQNGGALAMPPSYLMMVSEHLWELGARPKAAPLKKFRAPTGVEANWMTAPGTWVAADTPDIPRNTAAEAVPNMPLNQQAEAFEALVEHLPVEVLEKVLERKRDSA